MAPPTDWSHARDDGLLAIGPTSARQPRAVKVAPGTRLTCSVEDATDFDSWEEDHLAGRDQDEVTYKWTAPKGRFVSTQVVRDANGELILDANGNTQEVPVYLTELEGKSVTWAAPDDITTDTDVELTCTISDKPKALGANEAGSRDDSDLVRKVTVRVMTGTPSVKLVLYKMGEGGTLVDITPISPTHKPVIGGTVKVGMIIEVPPGQRIAADANSAVLRIKELPDESLGAHQHSATEDHVEVPLDLAANREEWLDPAPVQRPKQGGEPGETETYDAPPGWYSGGSPKSANTTIATRKFRLLADWNTAVENASPDPDGEAGQLTASKLLGHNWEHSISLERVNLDLTIKSIPFEKQMMNDTWSLQGAVAPSAFAAIVQNLAIQSVSPTEQFLVAPAATGSANFIVDLVDSDSSQSYTATVTIRRTMSPTVVIKTLTLTQPGLRHELAWDYSNDDGEFENVIGGYFTFDVTVVRADGETQSYRSAHLQMLQDEAFLAVGDEGETLRDSSGRYAVEFKYKLSELPRPQSGRVDFYQDLVQKRAVSGLSDQERWDVPVTEWVALGEPPTVRTIMQAKDNRAREYRDHRAKPMLNWNAGFLPYLKRTAITLDLTGQQNAPFREWQEVIWYRTDSPPPVTYNWVSVNSWTVNSGALENVNSDVPSHTWSPGGPIPPSSPRLNNVARNTSDCWLIIVDNSMKISTVRPNVFSWFDPNTHEAKSFGGSRPYRSWRFKVMNGGASDETQQGSNGPSDRHTPRVAVTGATPNTGGTVHRKWLRIHDDGANPGSDGCSAVPNGIMATVWERFWNIQKAKAATGGSPGNYLPYEVYDRDGTPAAGPANYVYWWTKIR